MMILFIRNLRRCQTEKQSKVTIAIEFAIFRKIPKATTLIYNLKLDSQARFQKVWQQQQQQQ